MKERTELGFLLDRLLRIVIDRERPIFERHHVEMWDFVVMAALADGPAPTQAGLAAATGRDKTRLIGNLDRLAEGGLISRDPDPGDRRNNLVSLTATGKEVLRACRADIRAMEDELLATLTPSERDTFERALVTLAGDTAPDEDRRGN